MIKKEVKKETASCETCNCVSCCGGNCLGTILAALWFIAAIIACFYACKASTAAQKVYDLNVLSAGWEANIEKMNELYRSEAYINYVTQQTDDNISSFNEYYGDQTEENNTENNSEVSDDATNSSNTSSEDIKNIVEGMLASSPIRGDANARFTIVEYTELHCPYCQMHAQNWTINSVIEQFPWEVNSVSRHFIIHGEDALQLAATMECVAELNPSVYHQVFEKAFEAYPVELANLINIAAELGTDASALQTCVDEWRYTQAVNDMMNQAYEVFWVNGTPGNVIIDRETWNYKVVSGAYPVDEFVNAINELKNA